MAAPKRNKTGEQAAFTSEEAAAVRAQLDRIIQSKLFRDTTRMKRFLRYITEQALDGASDRLKGYTIGVEVFDRPDDFDPQADTIVRVQAGQLRRRLELYYASDGQDDPIRLTVPKGRYAPSFEFREEQAPAVEDTKPIVSLLPTPTRILQRPGLAVVTLDDLTDGQHKDFFAEGLTAEIVGALVQFRHLRVVAVRPTILESSSEREVRDVGEQYDCQFVLSGNVRRAGEVFRVAVNLIETKTGQVLFSQIFDRQYTANNLFEIQESIASNVAATVAAPFGQINRYNWRRRQGRRNSISAYETVLKFYSMGLSPSLDLTRSLLSEIEELTRQHDNFSTGFAIRAMMHVLLCTQCIPSANKRENLDAAQALSRQAIQLDTQNAAAYFAAFQAYYHDGKIERSEDFAQRAMALNPNDYTMLAYFSIVQATRGQLELSTAFDEAARRLIGTPPRWFLAAQYSRHFCSSEFDTVLEGLTDVNETDSVSLWFIKLASLGHTGRAEEGMAFYEKLNAGKSTTAADWMQTYRFWQPTEEIASIMFDGWRKVGLDI